MRKVLVLLVVAVAMVGQVCFATEIYKKECDVCGRFIARNSTYYSLQQKKEEHKAKAEYPEHICINCMEFMSKLHRLFYQLTQKEESLLEFWGEKVGELLEK